jgi:hypothetical protein
MPTTGNSPLSKPSLFKEREFQIDPFADVLTETRNLDEGCIGLNRTSCKANEPESAVGFKL